MVQIGIPAIAGAVGVMIVAAYARVSGARAAGMAALAIAAWVAATGLVAASGVLERFDARPPPLALFMGAILVGAIWLGTSRRVTPLLDLPMAALVGFHAFRLPLELVLHQAATEGIAPEALTFTGLNYDIVTGSSALILAPLLARGVVGRRVVIVWNAIGIACLVAITGIAIATAPFVAALGTGETNEWVARVPYVWLPAVMVVAAIAGHVLVLRKLLRPEGALSGRPAT
jgi:hypothetical protein